MLTDSNAEIWPPCSTGAKFIVFRCPDIGLDVQTSILRTESSSPHSYESLVCLACTRIHFIDTATGNVVEAEQ